MYDFFFFLHNYFQKLSPPRSGNLREERSGVDALVIFIRQRFITWKTCVGAWGDLGGWEERGGGEGVGGGFLFIFMMDLQKKQKKK